MLRVYGRCLRFIDILSHYMTFVVIFSYFPLELKNRPIMGPFRCQTKRFKPEIVCILEGKKPRPITLLCPRARIRREFSGDRRRASRPQCQQRQVITRRRAPMILRTSLSSSQSAASQLSALIDNLTNEHPRPGTPSFEDHMAR